MNIICFSDISWNFLWQRQQQLLTRFPKDWNILYVEPSFWTSLALNLLKFSPLKIFPHHVSKHIKVISIPTFPFFDRYDKLRKINNKLIVFWTKYFIKKDNLTESVLLFYNPRFTCLTNNLGEKLICFDLVDDRYEFEKTPRWVKTQTDFLLEKSDLIITSSQNLFQRLKNNQKENTYYIGNGSDVEHFKKSLQITELPKDIKKINQPILGYIGAIGEWFDFELVEKILKKFPSFSFVIIGWVFKNQKGLVRQLEQKYTNFHFLGEKSYQKLPNYLKAFTVCMIPFRITKLTESLNPIKLYEYLAAGKPVVSTYLPDIEKYKDTIQLAVNHDEFLRMLEQIQNQNHDIEKFIKIAEENNWNDKAQEMVKIIKKYTS